jgi:enamine deaminase RidA (YjgF/YER057c/UK114 family)
MTTVQRKSGEQTVNVDAEAKVEELGLQIPDYSTQPYYGPKYGSMKSHHIVGNVLFLSGHIPEQPDGSPLHPGRLGAEVTVEQGYEAARLTALHCLAGIRAAVGSLDRVKALVRSLNFVVAVPEFTDVNKVSSGATDLFREVWGDEAGLGGRATIGVTSLAGNNCFENWLTVEITD